MNTITVAAAIILNDQHQTLLARKRGSSFFMQVGGKLEAHEQPEQSLLREIKEEIGVDATILKDMGLIETVAANEANTLLRAHVYYVQLLGEPKADAELAEIRWVNVQLSEALTLAPLTREFIFPMIQQQLIE
ncbi:MAG: NUDIX domain-containing protein [Acinetobacter sp.]